MKIKALSLWQPWASLIAVGAKKYETRSWRIDYRGPLLICASKKILSAALLRQLGEKEVWQKALRSALGYDILPGGVIQAEKSGYFAGHVIKRLPYGKVVALVDLTDCLPTFNYQTDWIGKEAAFGDFSPGRYAWKLENIRAIEPFPVKGRQGLFEVEMPEIKNFALKWPN